MSNNIPRITKLKKQRHRNRYRNKNINEEECLDIESTSAEPVKQTVKSQTTHTRRKSKTIKTVQENDLKKCIQTMIESCISPICDRTPDSTIKQDIKKTDTRSNFCSSFQKESAKPTKKAKAQLAKGNTDISNKKKINDIKQNRDKLTVEKANNSFASREQKCIKKSKKHEKNLKEEFPESIPLPEIQKILESQKSTNLKYVEGHLRINHKYFKHAYVGMSNKENDLLIIGLRDRNRAFDGDLVVASINEEEKWQKGSNGKKQKTGTIVCILEKIHPRKAVGCLKKVGTTVLLQPRDSRIPLITIYPESLPPMYRKTPSLFEGVLFLAKIKSWNKPWSALGKIEHMLGTLGDIEVELNAILLQNDINTEPFNDELLKELPPAENIFTSTDIKEREDWRHHCVFTIDPATAVDLDDAVSCTVMTNGNYEVAVHIADVTHYLKSYSPLDKEVAKRATTVYLANHVYPMLPDQLCKMCSLLPGQDKLTFSVIWEMTPEAEIIKHRFAKTIINSCCQMAYEQAQMIIEDSECFPNDTLEIKGNFKPSIIRKVVEDLFKLSEKMRLKRFADGALRIDQPKLHVVIDKESGLPLSYNISEQKDSNRLIEEFMLLANMTVATHLYKTVPQYALLRNHRIPSERVLTMTQNILQKFGIHLDIGSSGDLYASIRRYETYAELQSEEYMYLAKYRLMVINNLCSKAMARATYNCSANVETTEDLRHYALNVPFYTHFTSPIRRYPDIVVHRLLRYTLFTDVELPQSWNSELCSKIAKNCNSRKYCAKIAEEQSRELYFTYLIDINGPMTVVAIVCDVKEQSIEVILCDTGIKLKVYVSEIKDKTSIEFTNEYSVPTLTVTWKVSNVTQVITVFTIVHLRIEKHADLFRLNAVLLEPNQDHDC
ncbi:hypothetical protein KPH14_011045 [Odynerus spinipes]|uniref:RNB domain-containing protein n=1 Tax=Odynerus spinipes TaxID=1348599 RepID=A0AAD9RI55_9HYME|nr:hypothetical protein KPH14_011045 [Odynerus spinipes]